MAVGDFQWHLQESLGWALSVGSGVLKQGRKQQKKVGLDFGMDQV